MTEAVKTPLKVLTYMCPSHAVELYQTIVEYLEKTLDRPCELTYEWRTTGPGKDRGDPFSRSAEIGLSEASLIPESETFATVTTSEAVGGPPDLAFISSFSFQRLSEEKNQDWVLLPIGAVHDHPKKGEGLGYWSDLIIPSDSTERIKSLIDLRGCRLARPDSGSLSGYVMLLKTLREIGENPNFFGNVLDAGSHLGSVQMVAMKQVDCAAVDSVALQFALEQHPDYTKDIHIFDSYGPLPPYPIVVRSTMEDSLRLEIEQAFLKMHENPDWAAKFAKLHVLRYQSIDTQVFEVDKEMRSIVSGMTTGVRYY